MALTKTSIGSTRKRRPRAWSVSCRGGGVINRLQVRPRVMPSPADVKDDIEDALVRRALAEAGQTAVEV